MRVSLVWIVILIFDWNMLFLIWNRIRYVFDTWNIMYILNLCLNLFINSATPNQIKSQRETLAKKKKSKRNSHQTLSSVKTNFPQYSYSSSPLVTPIKSRGSYLGPAIMLWIQKYERSVIIFFNWYTTNNDKDRWSLKQQNSEHYQVYKLI